MRNIIEALGTIAIGGAILIILFMWVIFMKYVEQNYFIYY